MKQRARDGERTSEGETACERSEEMKRGEESEGQEEKMSVAPMEVQTQLLYGVLCVYGLEVWVSEGHSR